MPAFCADCGAPVSGNYCALCGQETKIETPTVRHFLQEFIDQYIALEGKLGRTLRVLATKPGQLTLDYIEGRRQRYVRPLKLYLSISVVFFTLLGVLPDRSNPFLSATDKPGDEAGALVDYNKGAGTGKTPSAVLAKDDEDKPAPGSLEGRIEERAQAFSKLSGSDQRRAVREKLADDAPYAMFFLLPYFALLLRWFYRKQKLRYGAHLLFSLHLHSFLFIALTVGFLPLPSLLSTALEVVIGVYVFVALRCVYGGTPLRTLWRMFWLWAFYVLAVAASAVSGVLTVVFGSAPA